MKKRRKNNLSALEGGENNAIEQSSIQGAPVESRENVRGLLIEDRNALPCRRKDNEGK